MSPGTTAMWAEEAAAEIYELGVTLEEYLDMFYEPLESSVE